MTKKGKLLIISGVAVAVLGLSLGLGLGLGLDSTYSYEEVKEICIDSINNPTVEKIEACTNAGEDLSDNEKTTLGDVIKSTVGKLTPEQKTAYFKVVDEVTKKAEEENKNNGDNTNLSVGDLKTLKENSNTTLTNLEKSLNKDSNTVNIKNKLTTVESYVEESIPKDSLIYQEVSQIMERVKYYVKNYLSDLEKPGAGETINAIKKAFTELKEVVEKAYTKAIDAKENSKTLEPKKEVKEEVPGSDNSNFIIRQVDTEVRKYFSIPQLNQTQKDNINKELNKLEQIIIKYDTKLTPVAYYDVYKALNDTRSNVNGDNTDLLRENFAFLIESLNAAYKQFNSEQVTYEAKKFNLNLISNDGEEVNKFKLDTKEGASQLIKQWKADYDVLKAEAKSEQLKQYKIAENYNIQLAYEQYKEVQNISSTWTPTDIDKSVPDDIYNIVVSLPKALRLLYNEVNRVLTPKDSLNVDGLKLWLPDGTRRRLSTRLTGNDRETRTSAIADIKNDANTFVTWLIDERNKGPEANKVHYNFWIDRYQPLLGTDFNGDDLVDQPLYTDSPWAAGMTFNYSGNPQTYRTKFYRELRDFGNKINDHNIIFDIIDKLEPIQSKLETYELLEYDPKTYGASIRPMEMEKSLFITTTRIYKELKTTRNELETSNKPLYNEIDALWDMGILVIDEHDSLTKEEQIDRNKQIGFSLEALLEKSDSFNIRSTIIKFSDNYYSKYILKYDWEVK